MSRIKAVFVSLYHSSLVILNILLLDFFFSSNEEGVFLGIAPAVAMGIAKMGASAVQMIQQDAARKAATIEAGRLGKSIANRKFINKFAALQAPTKGTEMLMERVMRQAQASTEASKEAGARGVIGGTGRTVQGVTDAGSQVAARLDDLQLKLDNKFLTEEQRIGLLNEKKNLQLDYQRLAGAQGAATAAGTASNQALAGLVSGAGDLTTGLIQGSDLYRGGDNINEFSNGRSTSGDFTKETQIDIDNASIPETEEQRTVRLKQYRKGIDVEAEMAKDLEMQQELYNEVPIYENPNRNTPNSISGLQDAFTLGSENLVYDPLTGLTTTR